MRTRDEERPRGGTRLLPRLVMRRLRHGRRSGWVPAPVTACPAGSSSAGRMARPRRAARPTRRGGSTPARPSTRRRRRIGCRRRSRRPTGPGDGSRRRSAWWCPGSTRRWCPQRHRSWPPHPAPAPAAIDPGRSTTTARPAPTTCTSRSWARDRTWRTGRAGAAAGSSGGATRAPDAVRPRPCARHRPATPGTALSAPRPRRGPRRRAWRWGASATMCRPGRGLGGDAHPTRGAAAGRSGPGTPPARPGSARYRPRSRRGGTAWPGGDAPCGSRRRSPRAPRRAPGRGQGSGASSSSEARIR